MKLLLRAKRSLPALVGAELCARILLRWFQVKTCFELNWLRGRRETLDFSEAESDREMSKHCQSGRTKNFLVLKRPMFSGSAE